LRSEATKILDSPLEIGSEMARIILQMRQSGQNTKANRQRLEPLAQRFLEITGRGNGSDSTGIGIANRTPGRVTLTM
jgi:hypothetical protein